MKVLKRKMLNVLLAFVMVFSFAFSGWGGILAAISVKAETTTVNLTFNALGLNGGENNDSGIVGGRYLTTIRFNQGVLTGSTDANTAAYDYSNLKENAVFMGEGDFGFVPGATKWAAGYKTDALFNFIYLWTANAPASGDTLLNGELSDCSLSMKIFKYDALLATDKEKYQEWVLNEIREEYGKMIEQGNTVWETIDGASAFDDAGSLCHGWSAIPVYYYTKLKNV